MNDMAYLFAAFAVIWTGVLLYMVRLSTLRKRLEERIHRLEELLAKD